VVDKGIEGAKATFENIADEDFPILILKNQTI
jgi:hypothetical protein